MRTGDFDYHLPPALIAQTPLEPRDHSQLMVVERSTASLSHRSFFEITDYLRSGDVLVFNDSRVIPARLSARKADTGGRLEILLLRQLDPRVWEALVRPAKRTRVGSMLEIIANTTAVKEQKNVVAEVIKIREDGIRVISFSDGMTPEGIGEIPLPPYIHVPLSNPGRYQTVYADAAGSVAAPTAGLHFTPGLIDRIRSKGAHCLFTTLHVGLDTFLPVREISPLEHKIHREYGILGGKTASKLTLAKKEGRRIICVGTTTVRLIEAAAQASKLPLVQPFQGWVDLFILPGYRFQMVDALITNFHLPRSTLLMLVTAFTGKDVIKHAYREAIARQYRFYSFGDAMLIL
ncbi:MAG: tRNA preQ1(34) S-adenosylmethionine ribosyltransferase-isomerase QueA [Dehalococcoidales bacterium]|nr:tRNA preQ1(34) S-adenosylmethionine ribosyltransferase-isomerase QueA [Dehalococcoidales bacterium]